MGQFFFLGKCRARCDSPGMEVTSSGVGMWSMASGISLTWAFSRLIVVSPAIGVMRRPLILKVFVGGPTPCNVAIVCFVGILSASSMANCSTASGHTNVISAWRSIMAIPSMDLFDLGYCRRTGHVQLKFLVNSARP